MSDRSLFSIINRSRCANQKCSFCIGGVENLLGSALGSAWFHLVPCCKKCIIYNTLAWFLLGSSCSEYCFYSTWGWFCVLQHVLFTACWLGSTWFHVARSVLFTTLWLGSCLVPLCSNCSEYGFYSTCGWFCLLLHVLFTARWLGSTWFHVARRAARGTVFTAHGGASVFCCMCY